MMLLTLAALPLLLADAQTRRAVAVPGPRGGRGLRPD